MSSHSDSTGKGESKQSGQIRPGISGWLRTLGLLLRAALVAVLILIVFRVSLPQSETIWTSYDTPNDLIRVALGGLLVIWFAIQAFKVPHDPAAYRTWIYVSLVAIPLGIVCLLAVW